MINGINCLNKGLSLSKNYNVFSHYSLNYINKNLKDPNIRPLHYSLQSEQSFNEWLAGVIDGDGHFSLHKNKYPRLQIDMEMVNLPLINYIQERLGGSIYVNANRKNICSFYLGKNSEMTSLVHRVNGNIRNSVRIPQFMRVCEILGITYLAPVTLSINNGWYSGLFDSDGCVTAIFSEISPRITVTITQKYETDVNDFKIFGGYIVNRSLENHYRWQSNKESDVLKLVDYFNIYPLLSHKSSRITWVQTFYHLRYIKAHKPSSCHHSDWKIMSHSWKNWMPKDHKE